MAVIDDNPVIASQQPACVRHRQAVPRSLRGFTLIELLVVVLIIGIVLSFVSLSISTTSPQQRLDRAARQLHRMARTAATDAILRGMEIGLDITPKGYRFVHLTPEGWQVLTGDQPLHPRKLGPGLTLVAVTHADGDRPQLVGGDRNEQGDEQGDEPSGEDDDNVRHRPEALFLSSGALIPFVLELHARSVEQYYQLTGHTDGDIELEQRGTAP